MGFDWTRFGPRLKKRREDRGLTQDALAARIGVRRVTVTLLEAGTRRPSLDLLEKITEALGCRVTDLLPEGKQKMTTTTRVEPVLRGAPAFFRASVEEASTQAILGRDTGSGRAIRADYSHPGYRLAEALDGYLENNDAREELELIGEAAKPQTIHTDLLRFFDHRFPGCMSLIPQNRRTRFVDGVLKAYIDGRLDGTVTFARVTAAEIESMLW